MTLILPFLVTLLIVSFYLHDGVCMQGAACEIAGLGSDLAVYDGASGMVSQAAEQLMQHRAVWSKHVQGSAAAGEDTVSAQFDGQFVSPTLTGRFWTGGGQLTRTWSRQIYHPAKLIRKMRGAKALFDTVRGEEN